MSDDRDRVTAILTLAQATKDTGWHSTAWQRYRNQAELDAEWLARCLLEALDTIDRLEGENASLRQMGVTHGQISELTYRTSVNGADPWWQALNGGNESGEGSQQ